MASERFDFACALAEKAGELALEYFKRLDTLTISEKGHQDLVSEADRDVETLIRAELAKAFPDDGIVGEEHENVDGTTGYTWVIDPIDGTANFVAGIPQWCVILACTFADETIIGVIRDPIAGETFRAKRGAGAFVNNKPIRASSTDTLARGSVGIGFNGRSKATDAINAIGGLVSKGGVFFRNASGGLMLAYAASGRLIGYLESHMHAWDCLAGMLIMREAGGKVAEFDGHSVLAKGTRVIVGAPGVFSDLKDIAEASFAPQS
ncbi:myo-inositol-1(or 4)-monophosphatase [Roseibium hamelinense]|uniref:Inositol-1-monophosphatase n=2 Tax=Roseibium hamelinense TaxID=150831 RepID=A0A562T8V7_9HYPH|nr:inositol monophosphatase family protein [Roseibium hamelinense]MTI43483.1 inositol monophosphatase [Roseibium hamelinense]TWI89724.1 myo-inositol-1(or 4)-monophosphatase [Roseibium hamelinense]